MPSARYLLVEGVDGHPVSDPHNPPKHGDAPRYVGWELLPERAEDPDHPLEHYRPAKQVVLDHGDIRKAVTQKRLTQHGSVVAKNHDAARAALMPEKPARSDS